MEEVTAYDVQSIRNRILENVQSENTSATCHNASVAPNELSENGEPNHNTSPNTGVAEVTNRLSECAPLETTIPKHGMKLVFSIQLSQKTLTCNISPHQHATVGNNRLPEYAPPDIIIPRQEIPLVSPNQVSVNIQTDIKTSAHQRIVKEKKILPEYSPLESPNREMTMVVSIQLSENSPPVIDTSYESTVELSNPLPENSPSQPNRLIHHNTADVISRLPEYSSQDTDTISHRMPVVISNELSDNAQSEANTLTCQQNAEVANRLPEYSPKDIVTPRHGIPAALSNRLSESAPSEAYTLTYQHTAEVTNRLPEYSPHDNLIPRQGMPLVSSNRLSESTPSEANTLTYQHATEITNRLPEYSPQYSATPRHGMSLALSNQSLQNAQPEINILPHQQRAQATNGLPEYSLPRTEMTCALSNQLLENQPTNTLTRPPEELPNQLSERTSEIIASTQQIQRVKPDVCVGPKPVVIVCPNCKLEIMTHIERRPTMWTHFIALTFCIIECWLCACLTYGLRTCNRLNHICPNCSAYIGSCE